jgi:hypothetical protein
MSYVDHIIEAFGGVRPMAAAIGKPVSTVHSWKVRGSIPDQSKNEVLEKGIKAGITLAPADFFPKPGEAKPLSQQDRGAA